MMTHLINTIQQVAKEKHKPAFSVYSSYKEQQLLNVPIAKPLLIVVLKGYKELGEHRQINCHAGQFVFLSDSPAIDMRNIPQAEEYFALLIDFDSNDYEGLQLNHAAKNPYTIGDTSAVLERCLQQFVESTQWAPDYLISQRKRELLELLCHLGYEDIPVMLGSPKLGHLLHDLFIANDFDGVSIDVICQHVAMSESTLRRKLKLEGTSVQKVKDQARLGWGLHLLQTTTYPISVVAQKCGYLSPSKFAERFKGCFGLTPSELKKTKMVD